MTDERTPAERRVDEVLAAQRAKGRAKYGKGLDHTEGRDWNAEAMQELADAVQYLAAEVERLQNAEASARAEVVRLVNRRECDREETQRAISHWRALATGVELADIAPDAVSLRVPHWAVKALAQSFYESWQHAGGAPNFIEFPLSTDDPRFADVGSVVVTVRRAEGKTPGQVAGELRAEVERLRGLLERSKDAGDAPQEPKP